jgi:uncharacterized protein with gpF-like domain
LCERGIRIRDAYDIKYDPKFLKDILDKINIILSDGYRDGSPIYDIANRLKTGLVGIADITLKQALDISRTEILGAASYSNYIKTKNSGYTKKQWLTARDELVRPSHREMEGKIIGTSDLWVFSDGDFEGPDHHVVNCRCVEVIVFESHEFFMKDT